MWRVTDVLNYPRAYLLLQYLYGAQHIRRHCIRLLDASAGERILDVGCGPAYLIDYLPAVRYVGFDTEPRFIDYARKHYGHRGEFFCQPYDESKAEQLRPFDGILLMGLLHHLTDDEARALIDLIRRSLAPGGRVVTADHCYRSGQSATARFMAENDRGKFVRTEAEYKELAELSFRHIDTFIREDLSWVPTTILIMVLTDHD